MSVGSALVATLLVVLLASPGAARAGDVDAAADAFVAAEMREQTIPGLAVAVVRGGKVVFAKGYGLANVELRTTATADTVFHLASVTKPFTAAAVLLLVEDGKLALDDRVSRYLDSAPEPWRDVTIRQLLAHTSGIKDHLNEMNVATCEGTNPAELVSHVGRMPLNFPPGTRSSYSNTGYLVLGMVVERVAGKPFDAFLAERVFAPLGMTRTRRNSVDDIIADRASGYVLSGGALRNSPYLEPTLNDNADAGLVSSAADLARWGAALDGDAVLRPATRAAMWTPATLADGSATDYGLGWQIGRVNGHRLVFHNGSRADTATFVGKYVDDGLTVVVLANRNGATVGRIGRHVAGLYLPAVMIDDKVLQDADPEVTARLKSILLKLQDGTIAAADFPPEARKEITPELLDYLRRILVPAGRFTSLELLSVDEKGGKRVYRYRARFDVRSVIVECTTTKDGKVVPTSLGYE